MNVNDTDASGGIVFAIVGNGFAIRACTPEEIIGAPDGDPSRSTYILIICQTCGVSIGSPYLPPRDQNVPNAVTTACPACGNHMHIDFTTLCMRLSTMHPEENHDEEVFVVLQEMREMGIGTWIDASMQS